MLVLHACLFIQTRTCYFDCKKKWYTISWRENVKALMATRVKIWCGADSNSGFFRDPRNALTIRLQARGFVIVKKKLQCYWFSDVHNKLILHDTENAIRKKWAWPSIHGLCKKYDVRVTSNPQYRCMKEGWKRIWDKNED